MTTMLSAAAVDALSAISVNGNAATVPPLDRKVYVEVNKALEVLGGKWNRKAKAHLFAGDPREAIERVVVDVEFTDRARELEFFATPPELAARLVEAAEIPDGPVHVVEPSAGQGAILRAIKAAHPAARLTAYELNSAFADELEAEGWTTMFGDFLDVDAEAVKADRIVMNSPFSRALDIRHVLKAWECLAPAGRLVAVMAAGVTFRQDARTTAFRAWLAEHEGTIEELPAGSFRSSGTMVNTVIVTARRG